MFELKLTKEFDQLWRNFRDYGGFSNSICSWFDYCHNRDQQLALYNGILNSQSGNIMFQTEEDMVLFILRWS
jgi:hypothetical protein